MKIRPLPCPECNSTEISTLDTNVQITHIGDYVDPDILFVKEKCNVCGKIFYVRSLIRINYFCNLDKYVNEDIVRRNVPRFIIG